MRSVTTREPEWSDDDRAVVLAYLEYEGQICSGCGGWLAETTSPENAGKYVASAPYRCHRCDAIERKQEQYKEQKRPNSLRVWPVELSGGRASPR